ncbi:uncharacterized protein EI97DRAFT_431631 [Westerdykella ornata]|uniref:Mitochondrial nucleoid factor 1 n=1 Tax=Westerdykella ornata TaxID=318751 RepID=A0A6A6JRQ4_WESOR|nr:uncharacterized protein EI97DRAFT_431631 [Westerdykella ornata]KAF2278406.1 hypothetical protein EI97DRAFT_431631 [Westerdykella ornata]
MSSSTIAKHYTRLLTLWPKDPLRREPFTKVIERRAAPYGVQPLRSPDSKSATNVKSEGNRTAAALNPSRELPQVNALYSLLSNRYSTLYPTSPALLKPASNPEHYDRLIADIERAPNKSWLQAMWDNWKMKIRRS